MDGDGLTLAQFADRLGLNLSAILVIGLALHAALGVVERDAFSRLRPIAVGAALATLTFVAVRFLILLVQLGDGPGVIDFELIALAWTVLGASSVFIVGGAIAAVVGLWFGIRAACVIGAVAASLGFAFTGHTQGLADPGLAPWALAAHVLIAGFWIAAPLNLFPADQLDDATLAVRLRRFSAIAVAAIPLLVVLGVWLALILSGSVEALLTTAYGKLLLGKLAIGLAGMAIGALNKQILTRRLLASPPEARRWLKASLRAEAALFLGAVVLISAATTFTGAPL
jgi:putative copper resistance protein D